MIFVHVQVTEGKTQVPLKIFIFEVLRYSILKPTDEEQPVNP